MYGDLRSGWHRCIRGRHRHSAVNACRRDDVLDDLPVPCRGVEESIGAVIGLEVEQGYGLAMRDPALGCVVRDCWWDPPKEEAGLGGSQVDIRLLAVGMCCCCLAVDPEIPGRLRPLGTEALQAREQVMASCGLRHDGDSSVHNGDNAILKHQGHVSDRIPVGIASNGTPEFAGGYASCDLVFLVDPLRIIGIAIHLLDESDEYASIISGKELHPDAIEFGGILHVIVFGGHEPDLRMKLASLVQVTQVRASYYRAMRSASISLGSERMVLLVLTCGIALLLLASLGHQALAQVPASTQVDDAATNLTVAMGDRLALAVPVAAAKRVSGAPVDDPAREAQAAEAFLALVTPFGVPESQARQFIQAQFEASKSVQRALLQQWSTRPDTIPAGDPPNLITQVRPALDTATQTLATAYVDAWRAARATPRRWEKALDRAIVQPFGRWRWERTAFDIARAPLMDTWR